MRSCVGGLFTILGISALLAGPAFAAKSPPRPAVSDSITYAEIWVPTPEVVSIHLHGGMFAPLETNAPSPTLGIRIGKRVVPHVMLGLLSGWTFERKDLVQPVSGDLPGLQPHIVLARADAQMVPLMGFIQVNLTQKFFLVPYLGAGAGYEWLNFRANDYRTGASTSATFSNFAWEGFGGMGLRLGRHARLDGELFYNGGSLERDVVDQAGQSWKEAINLNGIGARIGLDMLFGE